MRWPTGKHLYILQSARTGAVKVGRSDDPERRLGEVQVGSPYPLRLILVADGFGHHEKRVHKELWRYHTQGEWFSEMGLGSVPVDIWENTLPWYQENPNWWKHGT